MSADPTQPAPGAGAPSEEELRAAYEAELSRISVTDMIAQAAVSLLNMAARRLAPAPAGGEQAAGGAPAGRDLQQAGDAIDGVRALLEILERRIPQEVGSLREALSQLQMAYAAEVRAAGAAGAQTAAGAPEDADSGPPAPSTSPAGSGGAAAPEQAPAGSAEQGQERPPGPAESSGRLWVPGR
jgi:hypothetical protein